MTRFKTNMVGLVTSQKPRLVDIGVRYVNCGRVCKGVSIDMLPRQAESRQRSFITSVNPVRGCCWSRSDSDPDSERAAYHTDSDCLTYSLNQDQCSCSSAASIRGHCMATGRSTLQRVILGREPGRVEVTRRHARKRQYLGTSASLFAPGDHIQAPPSLPSSSRPDFPNLVLHMMAISLLIHTRRAFSSCSARLNRGKTSPVVFHISTDSGACA